MVKTDRLEELGIKTAAIALGIVLLHIFIALTPFREIGILFADYFNAGINSFENAALPKIFS